MGAYGGKADIMSLIAPEGPVYQAGTLSGNPIAVSAGLATLKELKNPSAYARLENLTQALEEGIREILKELSLPYQVVRCSSMLTLFFTDKEVTDFQSALSCDTERFASFWQGMLKRGIYLPPSQFEAWFVSLAHSEKEIEITLKALRETLREVG